MRKRLLCLLPVLLLLLGAGVPAAAAQEGTVPEDRRETAGYAGENGGELQNTAVTLVTAEIRVPDPGGSDVPDTPGPGGGDVPKQPDTGDQDPGIVYTAVIIAAVSILAALGLSARRHNE